MKPTNGFAWATLIALVLLAPLSVFAEEGGSGHYMPGGMASFVDALPGKPGLAVANYFNFYDGSASVSRQLPFAGLVAAGMDATAYSDTVLALYQTSLKLLGGSYTLGVAIPYVWLDVKGHVSTGGGTRKVSSSVNGIGPMLSYATKIWKKDLVAEVKWLPEMDVEKRLKGDIVWFKLGMAF